MYQYSQATDIEKLVCHLRDEHRLKIMTDYSYVYDYADKSYYFVCKNVWLDTLEEHNGEFGINFRIVNLNDVFSIGSDNEVY